jgi:hypothetical protein
MRGVSLCAACRAQCSQSVTHRDDLGDRGLAPDAQATAADDQVRQPAQQSAVYGGGVRRRHVPAW